MTGRAPLAMGLAVLALAWLGPLPSLAGEGFHWHMTLHVTVVAVAGPLVALGVAGTSLDPVRRSRILFHPLVAAVVELLVVWGWHAPSLHLAARTSTAVRILEQGSFLAAALLVWLSAFGGPAEERRERPGAGILGLLVTSMHMTFLGALIGLAPRPLYGGAEAHGPHLLFEQQLGGAIMLTVGGLSYLTGGLALAGRLAGWGRSVEAS